MRRSLGWSWITVALCLGCAGDDSESLAGSASEAALHSCDPGAELIGAQYAIEKSKFAFGSTPTKSDADGLTRWTGRDGVVVTLANGSTLGVLNGGAAEADVGQWASTHETLTDHVRAYFVSMGVATCQTIDTQILGGSSGTTGSLNRAVSGIPVIGSTAYAQFNAHDLSISEGLYWPTISGSAVTSARALQTQLADVAGLAAYKAKLPANAQGDGQVVIHHPGGSSPQPFAAVASYDVISGRSTLRFDAHGEPVTPPQ